MNQITNEERIKYTNALIQHYKNQIREIVKREDPKWLEDLRYAMNKLNQCERELEKLK